MVAVQSNMSLQALLKEKYILILLISVDERFFESTDNNKNNGYL